jgi:hypothetical protein
MKTIARLAAQTPRGAAEDALGLAALCLMIAVGFSAASLM